MDEKPKIYIFCNSCEYQWHQIVAIDDDGECLAGHCCSSHAYISHDMGLTSDWKHEDYNKKYPNGWQLVICDTDSDEFKAQVEKWKAIHAERNANEKTDTTGDASDAG